MFATLLVFYTFKLDYKDFVHNIPRVVIVLTNDLSEEVQPKRWISMGTFEAIGFQ